MIEIHGIDTDEAGRCTHYHQEVDVAALKCARCQKYYACYQCHDQLEDHPFAACGKEELAVVCGECGQQMNFAQYATGTCLNCQHPFNPGCKLHYDIYLK
ncbi:CHY zinc finger protein [Limosilactobacillus fermentum]